MRTYVTKCFTSSTDGPAHALKLYSLSGSRPRVSLPLTVLQT